MISAGEGAPNFESGQALAEAATTALRRWEPLVQEVPRLARSSDRAGSLRHLASWYARTVADGSFVEDPPLDGLDALIDELMGVPPNGSFTTLAAARWAVLVCEELVRLRAALSVATPRDLAVVAVARLELALTAARRQLAERSTLVSAEGSTGAPRAPRTLARIRRSAADGQ